MCICKAQQILPLNIQFHFNPLPCIKVVFTHVWYCRYCLQLWKRIYHLLLSAGIFQAKRKQLAINLRCTYCVFTWWHSINAGYVCHNQIIIIKASLQSHVLWAYQTNMILDHPHDLLKILILSGKLNMYYRGHLT